MTPVSTRVWELCARVAQGAYDTKAPSEGYADRVARILFMIAAHESARFAFRRQRGFGRGSTIGAFGLFQTEWAPVLDNLELLARKEALRLHVLALLMPADQALLQRMIDRHEQLLTMYREPGHPTDPDQAVFLSRLQTPAGDDLACVMARLHLMRDAKPIPESPEDQAVYAKRVYNTAAGAATPQQYLKAFSELYEGGQS